MIDYDSTDAVLSSGYNMRIKAIVSSYVALGDDEIVNVGDLIDHDCEIAEFSHILMAAVVRNNVKVEAGIWFKANKVVE